jgi:D-serine deaminase-like pyridoxal phosphate-dependent protein
VCVQKLCEAEALVRYGFPDVLITNEVVGPSKLRRLVSLAATATKLSVLVDNAANLADIGAAMAAEGASGGAAAGGDSGGGGGRAGAGAGAVTEGPRAPVAPRLNVLVELNVGHNRCGVGSPGEVVALARAIQATPGCAFGGIHGYHGMAQHVRGLKARADSGACAACVCGL